MMPRDDMVDRQVRDKCNVLFRQWAVAYKDTPGLHQIATLYKQLPQKKRAPQSQSKVLRETEADAHDHDNPLRDPTPSPPPEPVPAVKSHSRNSSSVMASSSSTPAKPVTLSPALHLSSGNKSKSKKDKRAKFNLEKEKPQIMQTLASASVASTSLLNGLQLINRESERVSENREVVKRFETCKQLRRQVLRYIQLVESDDWIGSLLSANDELVKALMGYEIMDKSLEDDSDSDGWERPSAEDYIAAAKFEANRNTGGGASASEQLAGLNLGGNEAAPPKPPRPGNITMPPRPPQPNYDELESESEPEDEDDPFGDSKAVKTPRVERTGMTWKDV